MYKNQFNLVGERNHKSYAKVFIDSGGNVRFIPLRPKKLGWTFIASMKVRGELARTGVEKKLKKRFKRFHKKGGFLPDAVINRATLQLAKRINKRRFILGHEVMVAEFGNL